MEQVLVRMLETTALVATRLGESTSNMLMQAWRLIVVQKWKW